MRRIIATIGVMAVAVALGASPSAGSTKTISGEVIDVQCQAKKAENKGTDHEDCALSCARRGAKMGILTADGIYVISGEYTAEKNKKLLPFVAKQVTATGDVTEQDGGMTINVTKIEGGKM